VAAFDLAVLARVLGETAEARVGEFGAAIAERYEQEAPRDSGTLASAFRYQVTSLGGGVIRLHGEVDESVAPHGKWIDQPVDEIVPVRAKALRWFSRDTGEPVFAQRVVPSRVHEGWWDRFVADAVDAIIL
jgi:hypothetical protein